MKRYLSVLFLFLLAGDAISQNISIDFTETAPLEQVYGKAVQSPNLISFNDLNIEFGYVLYQTEIDVETENKALLQVENVRDYAAIYINDKYVGSITSEKNNISISLSPGKSVLKLYVENIGRITYGPEILDNSKGLFGKVTFDKKPLNNWTIIPLKVKGYDIHNLTFNSTESRIYPCFLKATFPLENIKDYHLDLTGWGMVEVWVNNKYAGSYWEEEAQKSIPLPQSIFIKGKNEIVLYEMKPNEILKVCLTDNPVFK